LPKIVTIEFHWWLVLTSYLKRAIIEPIPPQRDCGMPPHLKLAVVLFDLVSLLDILGLIEQLGSLQHSCSSADIETDRVTLSIEYLGPTRNSIKPRCGTAVLVDIPVPLLEGM